MIIDQKEGLADTQLVEGIRYGAVAAFARGLSQIQYPVTERPERSKQSCRSA